MNNQKNKYHEGSSHSGSAPLDNRLFGYLPVLILVIGAVSLLLRARLSFCWSDESFYFSTSDRFLKGDLIFVNEWFPTQLVSLILLPFHALYKLIAGGNDGVILYFRILYVFFSLAVSLVIFNILKKTCRIPVALTAAIWYEFYAHLNIATLSYYTLSMGLFLVSMLLIYDVISSCADIGNALTGLSHKKLILSGSALALSVLSLPTLALPYFLTVAALMIIALIWKSRRRLILTCLLFNLIGILIPAAAVLLYVLPTTGLSGILHNLQFVLSDEEHQTSLVYPFKNFFLSVYDVFGKKWVYMSLILFLAGILTSSRMAADIMKRIFAKAESTGTKVANSALILLDLLLFIHHLSSSAGHTGFAATALLLFSLPLFALTPDDRKNLRIFVLLFIGGMVFSMTFSYSSLCDLYVLSIGHNISAIAGIVFTGDFISYTLEQKNKTGSSIYIQLINICAAACTLCLLLCTIQTVALRFINIYRDAPADRLTSLIDNGPAKGLYTTAEHLTAYNTILSEIRSLEDDRNNSDNKTQKEKNSDGSMSLDGADKPADKKMKRNIFFTKLLPWGYLATDMGCGAPTTWRTTISSDRLRLYYSEHPEALPDIVFELPKSAGSYETCGDVISDPVPNQNEYGGWMGEKLDREYTLKDTGNSRIYIRK